MSGITPEISVVIPTYNGAKFIGSAVCSVLEQTYAHLELVIVDDCSTDNTLAIVSEFSDHRVRCIRQTRNHGADAARNAGARAARGKIIAFLDQDDFFHPEKLERHVRFFRDHPSVGFSYNARFELNHGADTIREIWQPPKDLTLADMVLGFPVSPSEMVLRREWLNSGGLFDDTHHFHGGEITYLGRLKMNGCQFGHVNGVLNYRRHHKASGHYRELEAACRGELDAQELVFSDPRCPAEVRALRSKAFAGTFAVWTYYALHQGATEIGQRFVRQAIKLQPELTKGTLCPLVAFLADKCAEDETADHEGELKAMLRQLPSEIGDLAPQFDQAVARVHLHIGARALMWDRPEVGSLHFDLVAAGGGELDEEYLRLLAHQLLLFAAEYGNEAAAAVLDRWSLPLGQIGGRSSVRWLTACYWVNRAFEQYRAGHHRQALAATTRAVANNAGHLGNKGVLAMLWKSSVNCTQGVVGKRKSDATAH